jgi:hypothetical protein
VVRSPASLDPGDCRRRAGDVGARFRLALLKNRDRLLEGAIAAKFLAAVLSQPRVKKLIDHFSVDGTLIEAWASMKSFKPKDGPDDEPPPGSGRNA